MDGVGYSFFPIKTPAQKTMRHEILFSGSYLSNTCYVKLPFQAVNDSPVFEGQNLQFQ